MQAQPSQFRLFHLFYATAVIAVSLSLGVGLLVAAGIWTVSCYLASLYRVTDPKSFGSRFAVSVPPILIFSCCAGGMLLPEIAQVRGPFIRTQCMNNMRQIVLSMLNYETAHGQFPDAASISNDKPPHSWRVAILPYIDEEALFKKYDFDEPWDGLNNIKLLDEMPDVYRCPGRDHGNKTHYKIIVGPGSLFDGEPPTFSRIEDGSSNTIALIEDAADPVEWTKPSDITIDQAVKSYARIDPESAPHAYEQFFKEVYFRGNYARFDGSVDTIRNNYSPKEIRKQFGINDGIATEDLSDAGSHHVAVLKHERIFALVIFIALMLYPLSWVYRGQKRRPTPKLETNNS